MYNNEFNFTDREWILLSVMVYAAWESENERITSKLVHEVRTRIFNEPISNETGYDDRDT